jgi:hypothetical protein
MHFCIHTQFQRELILIGATQAVGFASVVIEMRMVTMNAFVYKQKSTIQRNTSNDLVKVCH